MAKNTNEQKDAKQSALEDLQTPEANAGEIKGGPVFMQVEGIPGDVTRSQDTKPGSREHILLGR